MEGAALHRNLRNRPRWNLCLKGEAWPWKTGSHFCDISPTARVPHCPSGLTSLLAYSLKVTWVTRAPIEDPQEGDWLRVKSHLLRQNTWQKANHLSVLRCNFQSSSLELDLDYILPNLRCNRKRAEQRGGDCPCASWATLWSWSQARTLLTATPGGLENAHLPSHPQNNAGRNHRCTPGMCVTESKMLTDASHIANPEATCEANDTAQFSPIRTLLTTLPFCLVCLSC